MKPKKFFLSINTQFENLGDMLIIRELICVLSGFGTVYADVSNCPQSFVNQLKASQNANVYYVNRKIELLKYILINRARSQTCHYFFVPGGVNGEKTFFSYLKAGLKDAVILMLRSIGMKFNQVGISLEHIGNRHAIYLKRRARYCNIFSVRDSISCAYAKRLGIKVSETLPDLSFNLFEDNEAFHPDTKRKKIVFSFREDKLTSKSETENFIVKIIQKFGSSYEYVFVAQVKRDIYFQKQLSERFKGEGVSTSFVSCWDDCSAANSLYSGCRYVFSNRLHVLLLAASQKCFPIPVINERLDPKILGVFRDIGASNITHHGPYTCLNFPKERFSPLDNPSKLTDKLKAKLNV